MACNRIILQTPTPRIDLRTPQSPQFEFQGGTKREYAKGFIYEQATPSAVWEVNHNMQKFPSVAVVDSAGDEVTCSVHYSDKNNVVLTFSAPFTGRAFFS